MNLELCNAVEKWVMDYSSSKYLESIRESLLEEVEYDVYRGDFISKYDINVGDSIYVYKGLTSWTTSKEVACSCSNNCEEDFKNQLGSEEEIDEYLNVVYVLQGSKRVIDLVKLSKSLELNRDTVKLINKKEERILYLENVEAYTIKEVRQMNNVWYVYLQS